MIIENDIYILIGCEESQAICLAFRELGFQAFSCDLKPCSGGHTEWHLQMDVFEAIKLKKWHLAIFHPDCTYLTVSGLFRNLKDSVRAEKTERSLQFVCDLLNCGIPYVAIENPVGCISTRVFKYIGWFGDQKPVYKVFPRPLTHGGFKPAQTIQPYDFNEDASKRTCLWTLGGLPKLKHTGYYPPRIVNGKKRWGNQTDDGQNKLMIDGKWIAYNDPRTKTYRSKTYHGIATAIAKQWGDFIKKTYVS